MSLFAQVLVGIQSDKLDKPFTYRIPLGMSVQKGSRVVVPFGKKRVEGYCIGMSETPSPEVKDVEKVRDILDVLDEEPLLTEEMLDLAGWASERFLARKIDMLQAMLPAGMKWSTNSWVEYQGVRTDAEAEEPALSYLKAKGSMPLSRWRADFPELTGGLLHRWQCKGIINVIEREAQRTQKKTIKMASLTCAGHNAGNVPGQKQKLALMLLAGKNMLTLPDLAEAGVGRGTVNSLIKKGFVVLEDVPVRRKPQDGEAVLQKRPGKLTDAQVQALAVLKQGLPGGTMLLHGVTGSGKTEVYLRAIEEEMIPSGKGSIVLVPEISLTPQMIDRFTDRFGSKVAVLHSRLSQGERFDEWQRVAAGEAQVVVGTRLAVFAPFKKLGLIIIDEEHEQTYKQQESPRYHAREVALWRAAWHKAAVILGSATPSLESYRHSLEGKYRLCRLPERVEERPMPPVEVVDMRSELQEGNRGIFSSKLRAGIAEKLSLGQQVILLVNRRGYTTFVLCRGCGHVMRCPKCQISLKFHKDSNKLCCHYCDYAEPNPDLCPSCGSRYIRHFGTGTQKVEEELNRIFPEVRISRLDADTVARKGSHRKVLSSFKRGETDILVGTQMVAKGLDFPRVTLVGVVAADTALNLPHFRAAERSFQLLTQVSGRSGRGEAGGEVIVQTYSPHHYAVMAACRHDYTAFYNEEIGARQELGFPPCSHLVRLLVSGENEEDVTSAASELADILSGEMDVDVLGPSPCPLTYIRGRVRWHLLVKGGNLTALLAAVREAALLYRETKISGKVRLVLDVDPQDLL